MSEAQPTPYATGTFITRLSALRLIKEVVGEQDQVFAITRDAAELLHAAMESYLVNVFEASGRVMRAYDRRTLTERIMTVGQLSLDESITEPTPMNIAQKYLDCPREDRENL